MEDISLKFEEFVEEKCYCSKNSYISLKELEALFAAYLRDYYHEENAMILANDNIEACCRAMKFYFTPGFVNTDLKIDTRCVIGLQFRRMH